MANTSSYPHSKLLIGPEKCALISGPHIQILDPKSGQLLFSTTSFEDSAKEAIVKSGPIRCAAVDEAFVHLATTGDDKKLKVWAVDGLRLLSERELPKKPTQVSFIRKGRFILVSDKFGDVFRYPLTPVPKPQPETESDVKRDLLISHENPSDGHLILGHTSLLTSFCLPSDEKFIITADRDEHIRVSWYPQGYCIENYCLGHEKYVTAIHIPTFSPSSLISGGGDPALKIWDWQHGTVVCEVPVLEAIKPFIRVRAKKRKWGDDEDEEGGGGEKSKKSHGRKGRGKNKQNQKTEAEPQNADEMEVDVAKDEGNDVAEPVVVEEEQEAAAASTSTITENSAENPELVFVLHKIATLDLESDKLIVFSAIGATALFWCTYPSTLLPLEPLTIHAHDFEKPVIDFALDKEYVWVLLDAAWSDKGGTDATESSLQYVKLVQMTSESVTEVDPSSSPLLNVFNTKCDVPASSTDLSVLDLYGSLTSMPKNVDVAHNPMERDSTRDEGNGKGKKRTAKEIGKAQTRKALKERQKVQPAALSVQEEQDERETKKARSDVDTEAVDQT